jgi:hypothetical protein
MPKYQVVMFSQVSNTYHVEAPNLDQAIEKVINEEEDVKFMGEGTTNSEVDYYNTHEVEDKNDNR